MLLRAESDQDTSGARAGTSLEESEERRQATPGSYLNLASANAMRPLDAQQTDNRSFSVSVRRLPPCRGDRALDLNPASGKFRNSNGTSL